jgi:myosin heavy chain 9/10/11/14
MSFNANGSVSRRSNPFARASPGPQDGPPGAGGPNNGLGRPKSTVFSSASPSTTAAVSAPPPLSSHTRSYSSNSPAVSSPLAPVQTLAPSTEVASLVAAPRRHSRETSKHGSFTSGTFAPAFIKTEEDLRRSPDAVSGIEGENDFSGKRYVWLKDPQLAFVKGWIIEDLEGNRIRVQCEDGKVG